MKKLNQTSRLAVCLTILLAVGGCTDADVASRNLSKAAEMFELERRIIFYNTWQGEYLLSIQGRCSIEYGKRVAVTCKTGPDAFKKHYLGMSGHVTYFSEQLQPAEVGTYHYKVIFKPEAIIPDIDLETSLQLTPP